MQHTVTGRLNSLINCQLGVKPFIKKHAKNTQILFLLLSAVTAVWVYARGEMNQLATSCVHWEADLIYFWDFTPVAAVTDIILINAAAAAAMLLMLEWNTAATV